MDWAKGDYGIDLNHKQNHLLGAKKFKDNISNEVDFIFKIKSKYI